MNDYARAIPSFVYFFPFLCKSATLRPEQRASTFVSTSVRFCWLDSNFESVCPPHPFPLPPPPPSTVIEVSNEFQSVKLCFNNHSTFLLLSPMLNEIAETVWPTLSSMLGMRMRTNRSLNDVSMSVSIVTTAAAAWDWIPGLSWSFDESNVDDELPAFAHLRSQHRSTVSNGCWSKYWSLLLQHLERSVKKCDKTQSDVCAYRWSLFC